MLLNLTHEGRREAAIKLFDQNLQDAFPSKMMEKWDLFKILAGLLRFLVSSIMSLEIEKDQIRDMFM